MSVRVRIAASCVALSLSAAAKPSDFFVFYSGNFSHLPAVEGMRRDFPTFARLGFTGVVLQSDMQYAWLHPGAFTNRIGEIAALCRRHNLKLIPAIWSIGYGAMQQADPNLAEGLPVFDVPYEVSKDGKTAVFVPPPAMDLENAGFEACEVAADGTFTKPGWGFIQQIGRRSFIDREVFHGGRQSIRFDCDKETDADAHSRISRNFTLKPNRRYTVGVWVRGEDCDKEMPFLLQIYLKNGTCLTFNRPRVGKTFGWTRATAQISTAANTEITCWMGAWGVRKGRFWVDDFEIVEEGFGDLLRRPGCPLAVRDAVRGTVYEEGRDYAPVPGLGREQAAWPRENGSLVLKLLPGGRIRRGAKLLASGYRRHVMKADSQISSCMSERSLYAHIVKSAEALEDLVHPDGWFLAEDEIRAGGTCKACQDSGLDMAHIFGRCVTAMQRAIRRYSKDAPIYMWGDQLDPWANGRKQVAMCPTSFEGAADLVPKDIIVMHWGNRIPEVFALLGEKGFDFACSRCFDGEWSALPENQVRAAELCRSNDRCKAVMYTTWNADYREDKLCAFLKAFRGGGR